jgi:capsular polysaccharide biosynthesis protein
MFGRLRSKFKRTSYKYPDKVYISRSKLKGNEGQILAEEILEASLVKEGYVVIHPQELNVKEQLFYYANADKLIFADGSAFHLYVLVANENQNSFIVWRRKKHFDFDMQLRSFIGKLTYGEPCLLGYYTPEKEQHNSARHKAKLDYQALKHQMIEYDFIDGKTWIMPTDSDYSEEIHVIEKRLRKKLVYIEYTAL